MLLLLARLTVSLLLGWIHTKEESLDSKNAKASTSCSSSIEKVFHFIIHLFINFLLSFVVQIFMLGYLLGTKGVAGELMTHWTGGSYVRGKMESKIQYDNMMVKEGRTEKEVV